MIILHQVKCDIKTDINKLKSKVSKLLKINISEIKDIKILRESLDARRKPELYKVFEVAVALKPELEKFLLRKSKASVLEKYEINNYSFLYKTDKELDRPVIIGFGPAGIFCAYLLAINGFRPVVLERGKSMEDRTKDVNSFWDGMPLNPESNVLFGEGGAGTFSDGKLNTLVKGSKDIQRFVMETFCKFGANKDICYSYKPHIGTDMLAKIIPAMREEIIRSGGEVYFNSKVIELLVVNNHIEGVKYECDNNIKELKTKNVCLAIGHSARDTFRYLYNKGIDMEAKPIAVGVRCEHDQKMINKSQYGDEYDEELLGAAPYKVVSKTIDGRGVYSFCMCPGGYVVNSSSEPERLCVNGMSYHDRNSGKANSAIVVAVSASDYPGDGALRGVFWQENLEKAAYKAYAGKIPVQRLDDFYNNEETTKHVKPCIKGQWVCGNLNSFLPEFISSGIKEGFNEFGHKIKGFDAPDTLLIGLESRTSSPVRINRNENLQSNISGLYPCGEGAGYAGGITSAAVDGCRVAEAIAKNIINQEESNE